MIDPALVRRRRLADRAAGAKVGLVLFVPLLGLLGLAGVAAYGYGKQDVLTGDLRAAVAAGVAADRAAAELSGERYAAAVLLLSGTDLDHHTARAALDVHVAGADPALNALRTKAARAGLLTPALSADLDGLGPLRAGAATGPQEVAVGEYLMRYTNIVTDLVRLRQAVAGSAGPGAVADAAGASGWLAVAREELAQVQLLDLRGADTPARRESLAAHRAAHLEALRRFTDAAPPAWRDRLSRIPSGLGGDAQPALDALTALAAADGADETALAVAARDAQRRTMVAGLALLLALVAGSIALAARVVPDSSRRRSEEVPPQAAPADPTAALARLFAGRARRNQRLADTLLQRFDAAERDEADPDRLDQLFAFDHLATRMRHDNQSLLVLAGADTAPGRHEPATLLDLLRAAQSRIEDYRRIEYGRIAPDVRIVPEAVDDVAHLLAELFDNAARSGPPDRPVLVEGRRSGDGVVVEVTDRGPGLDPSRLSELNARLTTACAPDAGPASSRASEAAGLPRTGLLVVARLAARHGLAVTLLVPPSGEGLRAEVQLPAELVLAGPAAPGAEDAPVVRRLSPRPIERSPALPGAEPVDIPHPRSPRFPIVPGHARTSDGPTVDVEPEAVRDFLTGYRHAITHHPVSAATKTEGRSST
ncbi:nitrate- and nitrite sensing domain-containing protein [Dactylosporangium sp. NPDC000555]|uniref:sensor histidine kinase n=1 Tax=Dactylosporangium sp. NPDC000555 TaxID=3154260 RepID=UPI00332253F5